MSAPAEILFIVVSRIGDTMFATPAIRALATTWPTARITVLGHPNRAEVFANLPFIAELGTISKRSAPWRGRFGRERYDLAIVCGFDLALVKYAQRVARRVVAFEQAEAALNARLDPPVSRPALDREHAVCPPLRLAAAAGATAAGARLAYTVTPAERAAARQRLATSTVASARPLLGLQVASFPTKAYRDWPVEHFAALCERITARWPGAGFVIFGGGEEKRRTAWLAERLGARAASFAGRLSLRETAALMGEVDLYIGVDTGPTHLMSTFDIPLLALYHGLSPASRFGPRDHPCAYLLDHPLAGKGCNEASSMADISVERVFAQVERALAEHPPGPLA